jgi:hypothetical protein
VQDEFFINTLRTQQSHGDLTEQTRLLSKLFEAIGPVPGVLCDEVSKLLGFVEMSYEASAQLIQSSC